MNYENFTLLAQKALKTAAQTAKEQKCRAIENGHILKGILTVDNSVTPFILRKFNIDIKVFTLQIDEIIAGYKLLNEGEKMGIAPSVENALQKALKISQRLNEEFISIEHILSGILVSGDSISFVMKDKGIDEKKMELAILELRRGGGKTGEQENSTEYLNKFAKNLNKLARDGKQDPVIGRNEEIRRVLQIISRRSKNNPVIIGEPGVGKTAIVDGIAQRLVKGDVPENLKNNQIYALEFANLIAGASKQGEFEERLKNVIREVQESAGEIILFIDEIHLMIGAGKSSGSMDAANILKPALARGELKVIGATTINEYKKYFEKDKALDRRFQKVMVEEPNIEDTISILRGIKEKYETHHKIQIKDEAIVAAVELSHRYITERFLPDKAIDLIDEAASKLRMEMNTLPNEIDDIERKIIQIQIEKETIKKEGDEKKIKLLNDKIAELSDERSKYRAVWETQKQLITEILKNKEKIEQYEREAENAEKNSEFEKVAEIRYGKIRELTELNQKFVTELNEQNKDSVLLKESVDKDLISEIVASITGIPVSRMFQSEMDKLLNLEEKLGKRIIGQREAIEAVSNAIRRNRTGMGDENRPVGSFIFLGTTGVGKTELAKALAELLFDDDKSMIRIDMSEYQEQHAVSRLIGSPPGYVGYEEGGQLTEAVRMRPYCVILFDEIEKAHKDVFNTLLQVLDDGRLTDSKGITVNFKNTIIIMTSNAGSDKIMENFEKFTRDNKSEILQKTKEDVSKVLKEKMAPEFLNRIDEIIMFTPLGPGEIKRITELQLNALKRKILKKETEVSFTRNAVLWITRISYMPQFGARPIKRNVQKYVLNELSKKILKNELVNNKIILIDADNGKLAFSNVTKQELDTIIANEAKLPEEIHEPVKEQKNTEPETQNIVSNTAEQVKTENQPQKENFWKRLWRWLNGEN